MYTCNKVKLFLLIFYAIATFHEILHDTNVTQQLVQAYHQYGVGSRPAL